MFKKLKLTFGITLGVAVAAMAAGPAVATGGARQKAAPTVAQTQKHRLAPAELSSLQPHGKPASTGILRTSFAQKMLKTKATRSDFRSLTADGALKLPRQSSRRAPSLTRRNTGETDKEIYGAVIYSYKSDISPTGFYKVPTGDMPDALTMLAQSDYDISNATCGVWHGDTYLMMNLAFFYGEYFPEIDVFDINTGQCQLTSDLEPTDFAYSLAIDPVTDMIYGLFLNESGTDFDLGIFDPESLTSNHIAPLYGLDAADIAFTPDGKLYCLDRDGKLHTINKTSGVTALVAETDAVSMYYSTLVGDLTDNILYFIGTEDSGSYLYRIDPAEGECEYLYAMPNDEEVVGGFFMPAEIPASAPAAPTGLTATFKTGALSGTVSFTMPDTTTDGSNLTGTLNYTITANGTVCAKGSAEAGSDVETTVTLTASDLYSFAVICSNEAGAGKKAVCTAFVGQDTPKAPTGVQLTLTGNTLALTWPPVADSKFGGEIDADKISYAITPYINGEAGTTVNGLTGTTYTVEIDSDPDSVVRYTFGVASEYDGEISTAITLSNTCIAGAYSTPYSYSFSTQKDMNESFTVIDANTDGVKWHVATGEYDEDGETIPVAMIDYNSDENLDDWLITSPVRLQAGNRYTLTFKALPGMEETMEVFCGTQPTVGGMTQCVMEEFTLEEEYSLVEYSAPITVEADGRYFIGFHATSPADNFYIYLNDIAISAPVLLDAPAAAEITATALPDKALGAEITITAPLQTLNGNELTSLDKIELYRSETIINTFTEVEPGATYTFTDYGAGQGDNTYTTILYNAEGASPEATCTVYVGVGKPVEPVNVRIEEIEQGKVRITWDPVTTDELGNTLTTDDVTYTVAEYFSSSQMYVRAAGLTSPEYEYVVAVDDYQTFTQFAVFASTAAGNGYGTLSPSIAVGKPYDMPFNETFEQGAASHGMVFNDITAGGYWRLFNDASITGVTDADGNNGYAGFIGDAAGQSSQLLTGKIAVTGDNPALSLYLYGNGPTSANQLNISVVTPEGETEVLALTANTNGWTQYNVSLKQFAGKTIQLGLTATLRTNTVVLIDAISVYDGIAYDLSAESIAAPQAAAANAAHNITVTVRNRGTEPSGDFSVVLYANGERRSSIGMKSLQPNTAVNVKFEQEFTPLSPAQTEYFAEIESDTDTNAANDRTRSITVALKDNGLPTASGLNGSTSDGTVTLTWSAAANHSTPATVTEDFEDYEAYDTEMGGWTLVDNDGAAGGGIQGATIPGYNAGESTISYLVMHSELDLGAGFAPHSGDQCISNMYRADDGVVSDWIISPELNGEAQTISLYARSYIDTYKESFRVLASSTDRQLTSFTEVARFENISAAWTEFEASLPDGTKYFAIETFSEGCFFISFDDITYAPAVKEIVPAGYNIYRDGELINNGPVDATSYTDADVSEGIHSYCVTTLYETGESAPCEAISINVEHSGITAIDTDDNAGTIYYDMHGSRHGNPGTGIYIRVRGDKVEKIHKSR